MNTNSNAHRKPDPRTSYIKVYLGSEELAAIESHCAAIDLGNSVFLRHAGLSIISQYREEQAANAVQHQQVIRYPSRKEGPYAGPMRSLSLPGSAKRRVSRGALRPMRS